MNQQKTGQFLKELRNEKKLTQAELAEMLGVSNRSVSRWENGVTMPDFDLLIELAKNYEVDVIEILKGIFLKKNVYHVFGCNFGNGCFCNNIYS